MRWIMGKTVTFKGGEKAAWSSTYSRRIGWNGGFYSSNIFGKTKNKPQPFFSLPIYASYFLLQFFVSAVEL